VLDGQVDDAPRVVAPLDDVLHHLEQELDLPRRLQAGQQEDAPRGSGCRRGSCTSRRTPRGGTAAPGACRRSTRVEPLENSQHLVLAEESVHWGLCAELYRHNATSAARVPRHPKRSRNAGDDPDSASPRRDLCHTGSGETCRAWDRAAELARPMPKKHPERLRRRSRPSSAPSAARGSPAAPSG